MSRLGILGLLIVLFAGLCLPAMLSNRYSNYAHDEQSYHVPAVRQIASHWPKLRLNEDSLAATSPGYHYLLATVGRLIGTSNLALRIVNWAVSAVLLVVLFRHLVNYLAPWDSFLVALPLAFSNFFVKSASWVVTDNAALLFLTISILAALRPMRSVSDVAAIGLASTFATGIRQMNVWTIVLAPVACYSETALGRWRLFRNALIAAAGPLAILLVLWLAWGGVVPSAWRSQSLSLSSAGGIYGLAVFAFLALFYFPFVATANGLRSHPGRLALAFTSGALFSLTSATIPSHEAGRWGGYFWKVAEWLPAFQHRSILFLVLTGLGTTMVYLLWSALNKTDVARGRLFTITLASWLATFMINRQVFHRYFEPFLLVLLIVFCPPLTRTLSSLRALRYSLCTLALLQLGITLATVYPTLFAR